LDFDVEPMKADPFVNDSGKFLPWLVVAGIAVGLCLAISCVYCPVCVAENDPLATRARSR
jgi:hypothetical protein